MSPYCDRVERTVILRFAVMRTLAYGTSDALIGCFVHNPLPHNFLMFSYILIISVFTDIYTCTKALKMIKYIPRENEKRFFNV